MYEVKPETNYKHLLSSIDSKVDFEYEKRMVMYRFLSEVERVAEERRINRKELARLIGTSASYITQLFRGSKVINMETIAKLQQALDITFEIKAMPKRQEEELMDLNLEQICETQHALKGFWAFHTIAPTYNMKDKHLASPEMTLRRTA